jgi:hypothetical protein
MITAVFLTAILAAADVDRVHAIFDELNAKLVTGHFNTTGKGHELQTCVVTKSTGDKELDATFCQAARACITDNEHATWAFGDCMNKKQVELMFGLSMKRAGLDPSLGKTGSDAPNH